MFGFLKDKVKSAISSFTKKFEDEAEVVEKPKVIEVKKEKKEVEKKEEIPITKKEKKKGFFSKVSEVVTTKKISEEQYNEFFWELEVELLENNVAFEVIEKIKEDLKPKLVDVPLKRGEVEEIIKRSLKESVEEVLEFPEFDFIKKVKEKKPYVIAFFGVNGSGKTTTIAKVAYLLKKNKLSCVLVAADTFRAASIHQLEEQGEKVGVKAIKHDYGSDPSAVAFDGIKYAQQKGIDVVLIDTAGRQHSNTNLMDELKKIVKVSKPDLKVYIGEMISGNDCIEQIQEFDKIANIDGVILSKADIDEKGGTALSVSYVTKKPIIYLGSGQELNDLKKFDKKENVKNILF
jgi:fused signal recognition particle receptor